MYKVGDIVVTGTESTPVLCKIAGVRDQNSFYVDNVIVNRHGDYEANPFTSNFEWTKDIRRKANRREIDEWLDNYN